MTDLIKPSRRGLFLGFGAFIACAPAIVRASSLMKVKVMRLIRPSSGIAVGDRFANFAQFQASTLPPSLSNLRFYREFFDEKASRYEKARGSEDLDSLFDVEPSLSFIGQPAPDSPIPKEHIAWGEHDRR